MTAPDPATATATDHRTRPREAPASQGIDEILGRRLVLVTGKGGTGKSSVAAAIALEAAARGRRVLLAEVGGERLASLLGVSPVGHHETEIGGRLSLIDIDPTSAAHDFLRGQVGAPVHRVIFQNKLFGLTMAAAPGLREVCTLDRLWDLSRDKRGRRKAEYDLVVVDAPATGHALAMLRSPRTYAELAGAGPIRKRADEISALLRDPSRTSVVLCALPEETPVNETLETAGHLQDLGLSVGAFVVNRCTPEVLTDAQADRLRDLASDDEDADLAARSADAVLAVHDRRTHETDQRIRLRDASPRGVPIAVVEDLAGPVDRAALERVGRGVLGGGR